MEKEQEVTVDIIKRERLNRATLEPFEIEADHPRNCNLLLQSISGCRLRSAIRADRTVTDVKTGRRMMPTDQVRHLGRLPAVPGMHLAVNPGKLSYVVSDPLYEDEDTCERLRLSINESSPTKITGKLRGVSPQEGTLDQHRMKTLCREIVWLLEAGDVRIVNGIKPTLKDLDAMPGKYLLNPGSMVHNMQPRYEEDYEEWVNRLTAAGG
jgi:hypothetical protein